MIQKLRKKIVKRLRRLRRLLQTMALCHRLVPCWHWRYLQAVRRGYRLCCRGGFTPAEAFRLGLFGPEVSPGRSDQFVSKKSWCRLQAILNPSEWIHLTRDKGIFYRFCLANGIPVPELFALFFREGAGWSACGLRLQHRADWQELLEEKLPEAFIIKPATGSYSQDVNVFSRSGDGFLDFHGRFYRASDIIDWMAGNTRYDCFVLQARLDNHPELVRLSATKALQTARIISFIDRDGNCRILHAHFKPITGPHLTDTFLEGFTGNVEAPVSLANGRLQSANRIAGTGEGVMEVPVHPLTGLPLAGFQLPLWQEACSLVLATAPKFLPLRAIGWDVALTPQGPVILEGNSWWDPPNQHGCIPMLAHQLDNFR